VTDLSCEFDGVPIRNLARYRAPSPLFTYGPLPENNILGASTGAARPAVADAYYLMPTPPAVRQHTLHIRGTFGDPINFTLDLNSYLTVTP
jgi:hypothetical protein